jgi:homoserine kinase
MSLREGGIPAVVSGAGPTVLAFTVDDRERAAATAAVPEGWRLITVPVDANGARVHIRGS